jgi:hypothetical protein
MPVTLRIVSVYRERKRMFAPGLAQARADLERFTASLVVRFGRQAADAVRQHVRWTEDMLFGRVKVLPLPKEGEAAVKTMETLIGKVTAALRDIRTPDCWFREQSPTLVTVPETVGLTWEEVRARCPDDGRLPVSGVLWLLDVLRTTKQVMPTEEQVTDWDASGCNPCYESHEWRRVLRRRKRRLVSLLRTAAMLEEEVRCRFR